MFNPETCDHVSMKEAQEKERQNPASQAARAASIAFVSLAESGQIDDVTATEKPVGLPGRLQGRKYP